MRCPISTLFRYLTLALPLVILPARAEDPPAKPPENLFDFGKDPLKPGPKTKPEPTTQPAQFGPAEVKVLSTHIDYVPLGPSTENGPPAHPTDPINSLDKFFIIRLQVRNTSSDKPLTYRTFAFPHGPASRQTYASLALGRKMLTLVNFGDQEPVGLTRTATIPPGKSIRDVLVFLPVAELDAKTMETPLNLSLPPQQLGLDPTAKPAKIDLDFSNVQKRE